MKMIRYNKYTYKNKVLQNYSQFETDVYFATDIEEITKYMQDNLPLEDTDQLTAGELLMEFFTFYIDRFHPEKHVISISDLSPWSSKDAYKKRIEAQFKENTYIKDFLLPQIKKWAFMIVDPFDQTYNPGKNIKLLYNEEIDYIYAFRHYLKRLKQKGTLGLDLKRLEQL